MAGEALSVPAALSLVAARDAAVVTLTPQGNDSADFTEIQMRQYSMMSDAVKLPYKRRYK